MKVNVREWLRIAEVNVRESPRLCRSYCARVAAALAEVNVREWLRLAEVNVRGRRGSAEVNVRESPRLCRRM